MLGPAYLKEWIQRRGVRARLSVPEGDPATASGAASALGVDVNYIIKSLLFLAAERPVLVIARGDVKVSVRKLAEHFGVGRRKIKLAPPEKVLELTGYPVGGMPPFGHREPLASYVDEGVPPLGTVYGGGGDQHTVLQVDTDELLRVTGAEVVAVTD